MYTLFCRYFPPVSAPYTADQCSSTCPESNDLVGFNVNVNSDGTGFCKCHYNDGRLPTSHSAGSSSASFGGSGQVAKSDTYDLDEGKCYKYNLAQ